MKSKDVQPRLLYPASLSFKIKGEIRSKKKLKEFVNTKPITQQKLQGLFKEKKKRERQNKEENCLTIKWYYIHTYQ